MDAFESAVAQVRGDAGDAANSNENAESSSSSSSSPSGSATASSPRKSRRGGARPGAGRKPKHRQLSSGAPTSGPVNDGPAPDPEPEQSSDYQPIDPAAVAAMLRRLDQAVARRCSTEPLTADELEEGGVVFAPVVDHYLSQLVQGQGSMWGAPTMWVVLAYGPRAIEALERRQRKGQRLDSSAQDMPGPSGGAAAGEGFSDSDARAGLRLGYVAVASV